MSIVGKVPHGVTKAPWNGIQNKLKFPQQQCWGRRISVPVRNYQDSYFHFLKNTSVQNVEYPQLTTLQA